MQKWKPTAVIFIMVVASSFGVFAIFGTESAKGTIVGGNISVDTTWDLGGSPYIVMENVIVDPGVTLTIDPGVQVKFDPYNGHPALSVYVEGSLVSVGEANLSIVFTSNNPLPRVSDWAKIQVNSSGHAEISFSKLSYSDQGILIYSSSNIVTNNYMSDNYGAITLEPPSSGNFIANNTAVDNVGSFLGMGASSYNTILNNTILNSPWPIYGYDAWHNRVVGNVIINSSYAIQLQWSANNNTVEKNTIENASDYAIYLGGDGYDVIEGNIVTRCGTGVENQSDRNVTLANNTIANCQRGIYFGVGSNYNMFIGNEVSHNNEGMHVGYSSNNTIAQNEFVLNSLFGLRMLNTSDNLIFHNNFMDNGIQALDSHADNLWDDGYPSGGNYWSDYLGNDSYRGPNQDMPGADGIGDVPYLISTNGIDRYPLVDRTTGNLPPRDLNTHLSGDNYENVTITWNLSWNDGQRANDVSRYDIYRSSTHDRERSGYQLVASTPNGTTEFVDIFAGNGNSTNYFYYVCAVNGTGNHSCSLNQVGKFTRTIMKGWNLVSIPLETASLETEYVFKTIQFETIRYHDASDRTDHWKEYAAMKAYNDLPLVNLTMGLWVKAVTDGNFTIAGKVPEKTIVLLERGWNLIGYPSFSTMTVEDLQTGLPILNVEGYDSNATPYLLRKMNGGDLLQPGCGYWVDSSSALSLEFTD